MRHHNISMNQAVNNQFRPESFDVVLSVYHNLNMLNALYKNFQVLNQLSQNLYKVEHLDSYLGDIINVSDNLRHIVELNDNIPLLQDIAPRIQQFTCTLADIQNKLDLFDCKFTEVLGLMESNTKQLEDMYVQYEKGLHLLLAEFKENLCADYQGYKSDLLGCYEETKRLHHEMVLAMPTINTAVQEQNDNKLTIEHLKASDLVTTALFTDLEEDAQAALKQIKQSEKWGNDETINRKRLNYKLPENTVMNVLKANNERLTKEANGGK